MTNYQKRLEEITQEVVAYGTLSEGDLFVLGCSTSEILGYKIGTDSSQEMGIQVVDTLNQYLKQKKIDLAVQACEHLNRALVVERYVAYKNHWPIVSVVPVLKAGGACATAAYQLFEDPVVVEHIVAQAGIDIGDTEIGMHIQYVQVPFRPTHLTLGQARVTALTSRPKYIGGPRAHYQ